MLFYEAHSRTCTHTQWPGLGQAQTGSRTLHPRLPHGWQRPNCGGLVSRKLEFSWSGESIPALRRGMRRLHQQADASPSSSRAHGPVALRPSPCRAAEHPMTVSPWQPASVSCLWIGRFGPFLRCGVARGVPLLCCIPPYRGGDPCFPPFDSCIVLRPTVVSAGLNAGRRTFD